jgi:hypothetical protein
MTVHRHALRRRCDSTLSALIVAAASVGCATPSLDCTALSDVVVNKLNSMPGAMNRDRIARENWPYAVLSNNVYEPAGHPPILLDSNEWQVICVDQGSSKLLYGEACPLPAEDPKDSGLRVKTYLRWRKGTDKGKPELVFAFRGSASIVDWWCGNIRDCQYDAADKFVRDRMKLIDDKYGEMTPVVATGHSLGGGLAQHIALCVAGARAVAFNTSPRTKKEECEIFRDSPRLKSKQEQERADAEIVRIHQHDEILSGFRHIVFRKADTVYDFTEDGPIVRHGITPLAMGLTKVAACGDPAKIQPGAKEALLNSEKCNPAFARFQCTTPTQ